MHLGANELAVRLHSLFRLRLQFVAIAANSEILQL
jgi:hypothetical protein